MTVALQLCSQSRETERNWSPVIARQLFDGNQEILIESDEELDSLVKCAIANKSLARVLPAIRAANGSLAHRVDEAKVEQERRMHEALTLLEKTQKICLDMNVPFAVLKSFDALPDLGHDIDLLVADNLIEVRNELLRRVQCHPVTLTFCDRQAGKFSTFIQGFNFDFELYAKISQLGEDYYSEKKVLKNRSSEQVDKIQTFLCSQSDRLLITCIHTLYRHGKIRLSDLNIAYGALSHGVDFDTVIRTVETAGIQKGFALFMMILEKAGHSFLERDIVPGRLHEYALSILASDPLLAWSARRLQQRYPLKLPIALNILLFLYKSNADLARKKPSSSLRSFLAPFILIIDKTVPLRLQKATAVRIW